MAKENPYEQIERDILSAMKKPGPMYWVALGISAFFLIVGGACWAYQIKRGMGVAGITNTVCWGAYIATFVFWVGIAHSGTLISAVLYLFRVKFRSSFNRPAEAMTVIAIMVAGLFPIIHLGRPWLFYFLLPYPHQRQVWVDFNSPLVWDVFAVSTYLIVSAIFFYVGMIPDLAIAKRYYQGARKWFYSALSLGWGGTQNQWKHYNSLCLFLASFATPLVVSVHSVVSWDFAVAIIPGWHATIFAPYFVAGAIFSGVAMVFTLTIPVRKIFSLEKYMPVERFENLARILLVTSLIVSYAYITEFALSSYSGNPHERGIFTYRAFGDYKMYFWLMVICNCIFPLPLLHKALRTNLSYIFLVSIFVNIGMWLERFIIVVTSLGHTFLPYMRGTYTPAIEIGVMLGSFGMFFTLYLIFLKTLPVLSITELKEEE